ncbi:HAD family hydrolase [Dokdonella sp. MW10]|uniref:HAD family hydrolase n=1 Tax=Dokdonella sp. MW10 TaxID=2992926 RepID=UPI003F813841
MNLALFDFDGTITTGETYPAFVRASITPDRLRGRWRLVPYVAGYRMGLVSGTRVREVVTCHAYAGADAAQVDEAGEAFARDVLPGLLRADMLARVEAHRARGDRVVVVSGAFDVYLAPWCRAHGLELLCSSLERVDGVLTGRYAGAQCVLDEKVRRVREACDLAGARHISAYGDTPEDGPMLALAHERWYRGERIA